MELVNAVFKKKPFLQSFSGVQRSRCGVLHPVGQPPGFIVCMRPIRFICQGYWHEWDVFFFSQVGLGVSRACLHRSFVGCVQRGGPKLQSQWHMSKQVCEQCTVRKLTNITHLHLPMILCMKLQDCSTRSRESRIP
jgi:hypothetical protein